MTIKMCALSLSKILLSHSRFHLLLLLSAILFGRTAFSAPSTEMNDNYGQLMVHGLLVEGACQLDMRSEYQEIDLGAIPLGSLMKTGDMALPVPFVLRFNDCIRSGGLQKFPYADSYVWDDLQPVVTLSFDAPADPHMPDLISVSGVTGLALKLQDPSGHLVRPGEKGIPQFLTPSDNQLIYTVTAVRTPAPLTTGVFRAVADFRVNYD
ncbi:fimbrial protein [Enterobacter kobei]|uniref:fimbrial protein n=1 Tax=Enterobacter kobei TaxID=208224 RepID=UPI000680D089|nr:fimbrial protein [Enterobacter kobei]